MIEFASEPFLVVDGPTECCTVAAVVFARRFSDYLDRHLTTAVTGRPGRHYDNPERSFAYAFRHRVTAFRKRSGGRSNGPCSVSRRHVPRDRRTNIVIRTTLKNATGTSSLTVRVLDNRIVMPRTRNDCRQRIRLIFEKHDVSIIICRRML